MDDDILLILVIIVAVVGSAAAIWLLRLRNQRWRSQVEAVARRYRLKAYLPSDGLASSAKGETSDGHDLEIERTFKSTHAIDSSRPIFSLRVTPRGRPGTMTIKIADESTRAVRDYGRRGGKDETGIDPIDERFHVEDRHKGMCMRLGDPQTLEAMLALLNEGGRLEHGTLVFETASFPSDVDGVLKHVERLVDLAERLAKPR